MVGAPDIRALPDSERPQYLVRDNDRVYGNCFRNALATMGIQDHPTALRSPWQNAYVERVIGSIRRELLDHVIVLNVGHLKRLLDKYVVYYNEYRTHLGLDKDSPLGREIQRDGPVVSTPMVGGLHHVFKRIGF